MSGSAVQNTGTTSVREGFGFDEAALDGWLRENVAGYHGPLLVEQFRGGQSNPTYKLITPARSYVLRRKPPGVLLKGAHAIDREARVLTALHAAGFPVARVHAMCADDAVIGTWFYVMEMVEGRIFWDAVVPGVTREERAGVYDAMNAAIAQLHTFDPTAIGLGDYGRPGNFFARQVGRWTQQYRADEAAGRNADMDRLIDWLETNMPGSDDQASVIHGDLRIDNIIFHPTEPRILAVLDWELSTLGHTGADFAYHAMMYRMRPHIVAGLIGSDIAALGIPDERAYVQAYCRRRGLDTVADYDYCMAFGFFRLAAIFHGIKGRVIQGTASSAQARERAALFPELASLALAQTTRKLG